MAKMIVYGASITIIICLRTFVFGVSDRFVFKLNADINEMEDNLRVYNFRDMLKITPNVYSFRYVGSSRISKIEQVLTAVKQLYGHKIVEIEQAKECINWIPVDRIDVDTVAAENKNGLGGEVEESETYFGMNVTNAWLKGYNGRGIKIAVLDNKELAFNFVDNEDSTNVNPEYFHNYRTDSLRFVDHGNRCASVICAEKGNGICSAGIAYEANVVPLKVFSVRHEYHRFKLHTTTDILAAGLTYGLQHIQIFSNSWSSPKRYEPLDMATREAILHGVTTGRNKLGAIYVVPDGSDGIVGTGLANSIYTITVNNVGTGGTLPAKPQVSACVLTSGLGDGNRLGTNYIVTSSYNSRCIKSFKGVSAAVAQISAIIALALQARPLLSMRDIQHILVESSDNQALAKTVEFKANAVGKLFNIYLGFGLIDAYKVVTLSKQWYPVGSMYSNRLRFTDVRSVRTEKHHYKYLREKILYELVFKMEVNRCYPHVNTVEHVVLYIKHEVIYKRNMILEIESPGDTVSVVVDSGDASNFNEESTPRNLTSVHFWGEQPFGNWTVRIQLPHDIDKDILQSTALTIYGTFNEDKRQPNCVAPTEQTYTTQNNRYTVEQNSKPSVSTRKKSEKKKAKSNSTQPVLHHTLVGLLAFWKAVRIFN